MAKKTSEHATKLAKLQKSWKDQKKKALETPTGGDYKQLPGGRYKGQVTDGEINTSQNNRFQMFLEHTVLEGEQSGETQRKYWGLDKPENLQYLHRDLMRYGYEVPDDPAELEALLKEILKDKPIVRFRIKEDSKNPEYVNMYIDKVVEADGEEAAAPAETEEPAQAAPAQTEEAPPPATANNGGDDDGDDINVGMRLHVTSESDNGTVKAIDEEEGEITVKLDGGKKVIVGPDDLEPEKVTAPPKKKGFKVSRK